MKIKTTRISLAVAMALSTGLAVADSTEQRLARMEAMMAEMQQRLDAQSDTIKVQEATIAQQQEAIEDSGASAGGDEWFQRVEVGGVVEVEMGHHAPFEGDSESDVVLATFELGISAQVTDWVEAGGTLLYEEDDTDLELDTAYVTIANPDVSPLFLTAGQIYVPFGAYETNAVSDPLTLEIGETRESAVQVGFEQGGFGGSVYVFNGENDDSDNTIEDWGFNLAYAQESGNNAWGVGLGYISDLGDSDSLQEAVGGSRAGGWTVNAGAQFGPFNLIGEYLAAGDGFDSLGGAEPSAFNLEVGYGFNLMGKDAGLALAYQGSDEAQALGLPEKRWLLAFSIEILDSTALSLEWAHDDDYGVSDGGTGENADTVTAQLAVEF